MSEAGATSASEAGGTGGRLAWRVVGGGVPTAAEIAALTVALTPTAVAVGDDASGAGASRPSNWQYAAIVEGVGGRPPASLQDVVQGRFGLGTVGDPHRFGRPAG